MATSSIYCLYLAKPGVKGFEELLTETANRLVRSGVAKQSTSKKFGDGAILYAFPGEDNTPKWVIQLKSMFPEIQGLYSKSPCSVLVFKKGDSIFALTFSYGHVYLNDSKTEADFGLKVAINAISDKKLRGVERSNIGAAIRGFTQAAGQRDLRSFGLDDALDLIRKVSGRSADEEFADMVTGSRSLRFTKKIEITDVPEVAVEAAKLFGSNAYKKTAFKVIDFLSPVLDSDTINDLDEELITAIRSDSDEFEISIPAILPDSISSFRFEHAGISAFQPDLSLALYREGLGDRLKVLTVKDLKHHAVAAYYENGSPPKDWSVYDALVGSMALNGDRYAINEGEWYRIGKKLKEAAEKTFLEYLSPADKKLRPFKKISKAPKKGKKLKSGYQSEESYNEEIAKEAGYLLLDQKLVQIDEVAGPGVEACDLLDIQGRRFIHVKKSSRQSSILSHFFKQGGNAARMLKKYSPYKAELIEVVKKTYGQIKARELQTALNDGKPWIVEFQIADYPRRNGEHNIPFFSKLTFQEEALDIRAMEFEVRISFITLARIDTLPAQKKV